MYTVMLMNRYENLETCKIKGINYNKNEVENQFKKIKA